MTKIKVAICIVAVIGSVKVSFAQEVITKITEDYSTPNEELWKKSDDYCKRTVENGMYTAKSISALGPQLEFGFDLNQLECEYSNDMEFVIAKLKGSDKSFISIELYPKGYTQLTFHYNAAGEWKLTENYNPTVVASGNCTVNALSNIVAIHHRRNLFEYFINGQKITERKLEKNVKTDWHDTKIYSKDTKMQLGLDKVEFIGYFDELNDKVGIYNLERFSTFKATSVYERTDVFIITYNGKKRLMDDRGRLSKQSFDYLEGTYSGNWLIVANSDKTLYGYVDASGTEMLPIKYKKVSDILCTENTTDCIALGCYKVTTPDYEDFYINPVNKLLMSEEEAIKAKETIANSQSTGTSNQIKGSKELPIEFKTKTHTLYAYPGWEGIFPNSEDQIGLDSEYNYGGKKPIEVFNEAPDSWIKNANRLYSMHFQFFSYDSTTIDEVKEDFIALAKNRTGWSKEKIKPTEERITLPDGRKGIILFYVCPDTKGMVGGNYFNCDFYVESETNKLNLNIYRIYIEGGNPDIKSSDAVAWKDYFKKVLLTIKPN